MPDSDLSAAHSAPECRGHLLPFVAPPVVVAALVYLNALNNPFIWDDFHAVVDNRSLDALWNLRGLLLHDVSRPLVNISFALDRALWGTAPFGFHLTSVLLHVLNVLLLFVLVQYLTRDGARAVPAGQPRDLRPEFVASACAWLFAVHPIATESVGYISGRADVLSTTFVLAAFLAMRRWALDGKPGWLLAATAACGAGIASKETAVVFPLLLGSYTLFMGGAMPAGQRRRLARATIALIVVMAAAACVRLALLLFVENTATAGFHWRHVLVNLDVVRRYAVLIVTTGGQSVFHPVVSIGSLWEWRALGAVVFTAGMLALAWLLRKRAAVLSLGLVWFLLALVPAAVLVLFDIGHPMAEHRVYLASAGLFMAIGCVVAWLAGRPRPVTAVSSLLLMGVLVSVLGAQTVVRNWMWSDPRVLWLEAAQRAPDIYLPHLMLGEALSAADMPEEAVVAFGNAVRLRPDYPDASLKLGMSLAALGRFDIATQVFLDIGRRVPASSVGPQGLGAIAMMTGRPGDARAHFDEALRVEPANAPARLALAMLSEQESRPAEALRLCEEIQRLAPGTAGADECVRRNRSALPASDGVPAPELRRSRAVETSGLHGKSHKAHVKPPGVRQRTIP